ncbi:MAG: class I SAM-dependent methyltransferase [Rhizomicrobium sp.]
MNALASRIAGLIAAQGPISVAQFMTLALHDPQYGYYAAGDPIMTDFATAPEISPIFRELLGMWTVQCWHEAGKPAPARLVELGPGRGLLINDVLNAGDAMPGFLKAVDVALVETNPVLIAKQQDLVQGWDVAFKWCGRIEDAGLDRPLFLLANEFFDALPIRQFVKTERGWCERMVTLDAGGALAFALSPDAVPLSLPERGIAETGAVYEVCPAATAMVAEIAHAIARKGGVALIVDYGYGAGAGFGETFQAIGGGMFQGLLAEPGQHDLSAHVDFAALAQAAKDEGAAVFGPVEQGDFLDALGIRDRARELATADPAAAADIFGRVARLIDPDQMGRLFKAMAILPPGARTPDGF